MAKRGHGNVKKRVIATFRGPVSTVAAAANAMVHSQLVEADDIEIVRDGSDILIETGVPMTTARMITGFIYGFGKGSLDLRDYI